MRGPGIRPKGIPNGDSATVVSIASDFLIRGTSSAYLGSPEA